MGLLGVVVLSIYWVVLCILIGGVFLFIPVQELYYRRKLRASLGWPQVTGTISRAELEGSIGTYGSTIWARVEYDYEAYGVPHVGTRIGFDKVRYSSKKEAQATLDRYPVNSTVTVYFDPAKPADSVLVRERRSRMPLIVFLYCTLALIALCLVFQERFDPHRRKPTAGAQIRNQ